MALGIGAAQSSRGLPAREGWGDSSGFSGCLLPPALLKMLGILTSDERSTGISRTVCDRAHLII